MYWGRNAIVKGVLPGTKYSVEPNELDFMQSLPNTIGSMVGGSVAFRVPCAGVDQLSRQLFDLSDDFILDTGMKDCVFTPRLGIALGLNPNRNARIERFPRLSWHEFGSLPITWARQRVALALVAPPATHRPGNPMIFDALFPVKVTGVDASGQTSYGYIHRFLRQNIIGLSPELLERFMFCLTPEAVFVLSRPSEDEKHARNAEFLVDWDNEPERSVTCRDGTLKARMKDESG